MSGNNSQDRDAAAADDRSSSSRCATTSAGLAHDRRGPEGHEVTREHVLVGEVVKLELARTPHAVVRIPSTDALVRPAVDLLVEFSRGDGPALRKSAPTRGPETGAHAAARAAVVPVLGFARAAHRNRTHPRPSHRGHRGDVGSPWHSEQLVCPMHADGRPQTRIPYSSNTPKRKGGPSCGRHRCVTVFRSTLMSSHCAPNQSTTRHAVKELNAPAHATAKGERAGEHSSSQHESGSTSPAGVVRGSVAIDSIMPPAPRARARARSCPRPHRTARARRPRHHRRARPRASSLR